MLPILSAVNRKIYFRYMPVQIAMVEQLPDEVETLFQEGSFTAKLTPGSFNGVWYDYTLETTENKDLKSSGGIIGITRQGDTLKKWFLNRPMNSAYTRTYLTQLVGTKKTASKASASQEKRWTSDVSKLQVMFEDSYINPFNISQAPEYLVNFATGAKAPEEIAKSMLQALDKGEKLAAAFVEERLVVEEGKVKPKKWFYDPVRKSDIKTMTLMSKSVSVKTKQISMDTDAMYMRLIAINATKKMPLIRVMAFENSAVPSSLFSDDGSFHSCPKSDFLHKLEDTLEMNENITRIAPSNCVIFDCLALIQKLMLPTRCEMLTFRDVCKLFMEKVMQIANPISAKHCDTHLVFDHYEEDSIKSQAREKRTGKVGHVIHIKAGGNVPKNWKNFLAHPENKEGLSRCIADYIKEEGSAFIKDDNFLWVSGGKNFKTFRISKTEVFSASHLDSIQEEADTRIVLHLQAAARQGIKRAVVYSPDTDVAVLLLHHRSAIDCEEIYMLTGKEEKHTFSKRFIPIHEIHKKLSQDELNILLSVYCISGCDTVSSFFGHGKKSAFKVLKKYSSDLQGLKDMGQNSALTREQIDAGVKFVGMLYGDTNTTSLNSLRSGKASGKVGPRKLPPTDDSLKSHLLRSVLQLYVWRHALIPNPTALEPTSFGWKRDESNERLIPVMMTQPAAAPELLNDVVCECTDFCSTACKCARYSQSCTAACSCKPFEDNEPDEECQNPNRLLEFDSAVDVEEMAEEEDYS